MPRDSAPITTRAPDDITSVFTDLVSRIQFKFLAFMFIAFIMLNSDSFVNRVLSTIEGAVDFKTPSSWGVCLQGMFLVIIMIVLDGLIGLKVV